MSHIDLIRSLKTKNDSKIVMFVADGLGGLPQQPGGPTELEAAKTPNLDALATRGVLGGSIPVKPGISPGSGPGHLGLFGYDPLTSLIGRGALEATGIGLTIQDGDVAVRCNFCTIDGDGNITDRRAGRIPTEESAPLAIKLREVKIPGIEITVEPVKEHRFVVLFRGEGLGGEVHDTDPQATGVPPLDPVAVNEASQKTAEISKEFVKQAKKLLAGEAKANCLTMRGWPVWLAWKLLVSHKPYPSKWICWKKNGTTTISSSFTLNTPIQVAKMAILILKYSGPKSSTTRCHGLKL